MLASMNRFTLLIAILLFFNNWIPLGNLQGGANPFRWFPPDNFDILSRNMDEANPENCASMSESNLRLPFKSMSQIPQYNKILLQQWFTNRSKLLHLHNLALNRAVFYSYIMQRLDGPVIDPPLLPSLMYYYLSASADVSSGPNVMNASAILMDTNTTYANWYGLKVINHTLPLFGPMARRLDNWNDETNFLRIPTNNTIKILDLGAGPNSNYTAPWYKNNPYIRDPDMHIEFIPDHRGTAPSKSQYTAKIQLATIDGTPIESLETVRFYGPNAPGIKEKFQPVRFTRPYYDCGGSNRWIVSSVAALSDYMPRYSNITRLRGPRMVGLSVLSIDFYRIDFNPCPPGQGNPDHFLARIARCKPTTLCVPLPGFGFRRGGYECVCQPGYRLPYFQNGPFQGVHIEQATQAEYEAGFDCLPVGWREVIPEETGIKGDLERRRRSLVADSKRWVWPNNDSSVTSFSQLSFPWPSIREYGQQLWLRIFPPERPFSWSTIQSYADRLWRRGRSVNSLHSDDWFPSHNHTVDELPIYLPHPEVVRDERPRWMNLNNTTNKGAAPINVLRSITRLKRGIKRRLKLKNIRDSSWRLAFTHGQPRQRAKRNVDVPFYYIGSGTVFNNDRYFEVHRLIAHAREVTNENCHLMSPDRLVFPGEVSYGAESQFEMIGRTALRLSHFLSAYYQNNVPNEVYGSLVLGQRLNRFQLFGEVFANVLSNFDIVSSGIYFDYQMFKDHTGQTWDLFAPYAFKPHQSTQAAEAIDMSIDYYRNYMEKPWFRVLKERWASSRFGLEKITTKPYIRSDVNGTQIQRYFNFPIYYRIPSYEDGYWTQPYFDCDGKVKEWIITYSAPFFGIAGEDQGLQFMGVTTVSVKLLSLDINQCPQSFYTPNFFKDTARCDFRSTYCVPIPRRYFVAGSYKCECREGFEYPFNDRTWFFHGETMEKQYALKLAGKPNRFDLLRCRQGYTSSIVPLPYLLCLLTVIVCIFSLPSSI